MSKKDKRKTIYNYNPSASKRVTGVYNPKDLQVEDINEVDVSETREMDSFRNDFQAITGFFYASFIGAVITSYHSSLQSGDHSSPAILDSPLTNTLAEGGGQIGRYISESPLLVILIFIAVSLLDWVSMSISTNPHLSPIESKSRYTTHIAFGWVVSVVSIVSLGLFWLECIKPSQVTSIESARYMLMGYVTISWFWAFYALLGKPKDIIRDFFSEIHNSLENKYRKFDTFIETTIRENNRLYKDDLVHIGRYIATLLASTSMYALGILTLVLAMGSPIGETVHIALSASIPTWVFGTICVRRIVSAVFGFVLL